MYSAQLGRFISRDPLGFVDGMNLYRAYFVPGGVDPIGLDKLLLPCPSRTSTGKGTAPPIFLVPKMCVEIHLILDQDRRRRVREYNRKLHRRVWDAINKESCPNECQKRWGFEKCPTPAKKVRTVMDAFVRGRLRIHYLSNWPVLVNCRAVKTISESPLPNGCPSGGSLFHCKVYIQTLGGKELYKKPNPMIVASAYACNCCHETKRGTYAHGAHWGSPTTGPYGIDKYDALTPIFN